MTASNRAAGRLADLAGEPAGVRVAVELAARRFRRLLRDPGPPKAGELA